MFSFFKRDKVDPPAEPKTPRRKFSELFVRELQKRGLTVALLFDEEAFTLSTSESEQHIIYLGNLFSEYEKANTPDAKTRVMEQASEAHYEAFSPTVHDLESVRDKLIPAIRERCFVEFTNLQSQIDHSNSLIIATNEFSENLVVCIAIDYSHSLNYATSSDLARWGITFDDAYQLAYRNLFEVTGSFEEMHPGLYRGPWNDCYVPSRLLFLELIRELSVEGQPVAIAPNRNTLIVTGSEDIEGQKTMLSLMREGLKEPRSMSPRPLILKDGEWLNYFPQHDTPLFDDYAKLRVEVFGQDYADQKELLEKLHQKTGEDIYVATYGSIEEKETKKIQSYCTWSRDVLTLLPKTDLIIFHDHEKPEGRQIVCKAQWADTQKVVGALMQPQGLYPERYKVAAFPDPKALEDIHRPGDA